MYVIITQLPSVSKSDSQTEKFLPDVIQLAYKTSIACVPEWRKKEIGIIHKKEQIHQDFSSGV